MPGQSELEVGGGGGLQLFQCVKVGQLRPIDNISMILVFLKLHISTRGYMCWDTAVCELRSWRNTTHEGGLGHKDQHDVFDMDYLMCIHKWIQSASTTHSAWAYLTALIPSLSWTEASPRNQYFPLHWGCEPSAVAVGSIPSRGTMLHVIPPNLSLSPLSCPLFKQSYQVQNEMKAP